MDKILINGEALDFSGSYNISLEANDYLNFKPGTAFKSERLTLFNTPKNRRLLQNIFHINTTGNTTFDAIIITPVIQMSGVLQVLTVDQDRAEGVFISGNGKLWDNLKGIKMNEIDCSEYDHKLNMANVIASETYSDSHFYIYDFCNRGTNIHYGGIDITERFPAISLRLLLSKIFAGYNLSGDLIDETKFKRLFLLFTQSNQIRNSEEWKKTAIFSVGKTDDQSHAIGTGAGSTFVLNPQKVTFVDTDPFYDNGNNFADSVYTVPETGTYRFIVYLDGKINLSVGAGTVSGSLVFTLNINGTVSKTVTKTFSNYLYDYTTGIDTGFIECTVGDEISFHISTSGTYTGTLTFPVLKVLSTSVANVTVSRWYGYGSTVHFSEVLPEIDTLDFLADIFLYFGLFPLYDVEGKNLYLYQLKTNTTVKNISSKITPDGVLFEIPEPTNIKLCFAKDSSDKMMEYAIDNNLMSDGSYEYNIQKKDTKEIKLKYLCNTYFDTYKLLDIATSFKVPILWSDLSGSKYSTKFGLRLLYYEGTRDHDYLLHHGHVPGYSDPTTRTVAPVFSNNDTENLLFGGTNGMAQYHIIALQMATQGKVVTCDVMLNSAEISQLYSCTGNDLRVPIFIENKYISGNFMILKLKQKAGNLFELSLLQKFD